ncbi:hypothetical protein N8T08_000458 [Aspergillus melleus]|uniref:Uncharacterized protein n=1 Tax=Aspergillus melleus TaxID=138277 RepID=A0ACC3BBE5_9EURO|nr:hypothetical protein N8T08_000458 [Aspergillus melleus]
MSARKLYRYQQISRLDLETKPSEIKRRLIPLESPKSDHARDVRGTQWKTAQFSIKQQMNLPPVFGDPSTTIAVRFKIEGGCANRRVIVQFLVYNEDELVFTPSFEVHPYHVLKL